MYLVLEPEMSRAWSLEEKVVHVKPGHSGT